MLDRRAPRRRRRSPEWLLIRELLRGRDDESAPRARLPRRAVRRGRQTDGAAARIALIGLRGAGKSTLGQMLADDLRVPFVELDRDIERIAGCDVGEIHALYGPAPIGATSGARWRKRSRSPDAVIATPGGLVSEPRRSTCCSRVATTVWLRASPEEHMSRVDGAGRIAADGRQREAMDDLRRILAGRAAYYGRPTSTFDTSGKTLPIARSLTALRAR